MKRIITFSSFKFEYINSGNATKVCPKREHFSQAKS